MERIFKKLKICSKLCCFTVVVMKKEKKTGLDGLESVKDKDWKAYIDSNMKQEQIKTQ